MVTWSDREITCNDLDKSNLNTYLLFRDSAWSYSATTDAATGQGSS